MSVSSQSSTADTKAAQTQLKSDKEDRRPWWRRKLGPQAYLIIVFIIVAVVGTLTTDFFLTARNLENILVTSSVVAVLGVAQFTVVVTRGIDLSVGSVAALSTVVVAVLLQQGQSALVAIVAALLVSAFAGFVNGVLVVHARITAFVATLAMLSIARGVAFLIQIGTLIVISNESFLNIFGGKTASIPHTVLIALVVTVVAALIMKLSPFGRRLYAIGGNPEAARLSGLPVKRDQILAYTSSGFLAGVAGLMIAGRLSQGSSLVGQGYELDSIAATVVGGTSLYGGVGDPVSTVLGALIIGMIGNVMNLNGIPSEPQLVILGCVILIAVFLTSGGGIQRIRTALMKKRKAKDADHDGAATQNPPSLPREEQKK